MNDALRLLAKVMRRFGYDIKKYGQYNLLPVANIAEFNQLSTLYNTKDTYAVPGSNKLFKQLFVCLRTCLRKSSKTVLPNVAGVARSELVCKCAVSLIASINRALEFLNDTGIKLVVFDDHSDAEYLGLINRICGLVKCDYQIIHTSKRGQGESLFEQFSFARDKNALFYFCEDDYLHEPGAVLEMCRFYQQVYTTCGTHLVIHPQEHEFLLFEIHLSILCAAR
jgi:hypothetical protein